MTQLNQIEIAQVSGATTITDPVAIAAFMAALIAAAEAERRANQAQQMN